MAKYKYNGEYITKEEWDALPKKDLSAKSFHVNLSMKEYVSPMSGKLVSDRTQRRAEMKEYNVREVDPSEYKKILRDKGFEDGRR